MANELLREVATERGWSEQEVNWMAQAAKILHDAFSEDRHKQVRIKEAVNYDEFLEACRNLGTMVNIIRSNLGE